uniref:Uncharacterized protein n=1 Tax=Melopsittacus undulatus TaxID=13146 RepID=A0A8V5GIE0_MELUD
MFYSLVSCVILSLLEKIKWLVLGGKKALETVLPKFIYASPKKASYKSSLPISVYKLVLRQAECNLAPLPMGPGFSCNNCFSPQ